MNVAVEQGFYPLLKPVKNRADIGRTIIVSQDERTGEVTTKGIHYGLKYADSEEAGERYWFKDGHHEFPFAVYLIPSDLVVGEEVWLDDLIEDFQAKIANFSDVSKRKSSAKAICSEGDFVINTKGKGPLIVG